MVVVKLTTLAAQNEACNLLFAAGYTYQLRNTVVEYYIYVNTSRVSIIESILKSLKDSIEDLY